METKNQNPPCHEKRIPLWLVLLDNLPTLALFILGFLIIKPVSAIFAVSFLIYAFFSIVWFWVKICPWCHHFGTFACPCGYGAVAPKLTRRKTGKSFRKVFRKHIWIVVPNWFVPSAFAAYLLITDYSTKILVLSVAFGFTGFIVIPLISKLVGCKNCEIKDDCPWMTGKKD